MDKIVAGRLRHFVSKIGLKQRHRHALNVHLKCCNLPSSQTLIKAVGYPYYAGKQESHSQDSQCKSENQRRFEIEHLSGILPENHVQYQTVDMEFV